MMLSAQRLRSGSDPATASAGIDLRQPDPIISVSFVGITRWSDGSSVSHAMSSGGGGGGFTAGFDGQLTTNGSDGGFGPDGIAPGAAGTSGSGGGGGNAGTGSSGGGGGAGALGAGSAGAGSFASGGKGGASSGSGFAGGAGVGNGGRGKYGGGGAGGGGFSGAGGGGGSYLDSLLSASALYSSYNNAGGNGFITITPVNGQIATIGYSGVVQSYTCAASGEYDIVAAGAQGGGGLIAVTRVLTPGGLGAQIGGRGYFTAGSTLDLVVGGQGDGNNGYAGGGGGGGGSFVFLTYEAPGTVAGVPEPATWAMMIAGFGVIGASMRRRKVAVRFA